MGVVAHPIVVAQSAALMMVVVTAVASVPDKMRIDGQCVCQPDCGGAVCGTTDGCGNSCGSCRPSQFCSNGQCLPIIIDPPVVGSDAGTTTGSMDAGTVGALDAGPSSLDTCTTDNYFHCGEGSDFLPVLAPVASRAIAQAVQNFAPVVRAVALFPVALVLNLVVRTACVTAVITVVAILKAMRVDTVQIPLAMVSTAATGFAKRGQSHFVL